MRNPAPAAERKRQMPISVKLISVLIVNLLLVMAAIGSIMFITSRRALYAEFDTDSARRMDRLSFVIRDPLWFLDTDSIDKLIDFEIADHDVLSITVLAEDRTVIRAKKKLGDAITEFIPGAAESVPGVPAWSVLEKEVTKDGALIGYIVMETTDAAIRQEIARTVRRLVAELALLTLVLTLVIFISVRKLVISRIGSMRTFIGRLSEGDLTGTLSITSGDEMEELSWRLNQFITSLKSMLAHLKTVSTGNTEEGAEIAASMGGISSTMEEIDTTMHRIAGETGELKERIAGSAEAADDIKENLRELSGKIEVQYESVTASVTDVRTMIASVGTFADSTSSRLELLHDLSRRIEAGNLELQKTKSSMNAITRSIGLVREIVEVIEGVAERSNLLAMNAAVEAAHAGQAGKGFAVVAGEIRKLSTTTSENAKKVAGTIRAIVSGIEETETFTENTGALIRNILGDVQGISRNISDLLESVQAISRDGETVNHRLSNVISLSGEVKTFASAIDAKSDTIKTSMQTVRTLAEGTLLGVTEIKEGIAGVSSSMESLTALGARNSQTIRTIEEELSRFTTE